MTGLSISDAWDETRGFLSREGRLLAPLSLAFLFLPVVITGLVQFAEHGKMSTSPAYLLLFVAQLLISAVGQLSIARMTLGHRDRLGDTIGHAVRRLPTYIGTVAIFALPMSVLFGVAMMSAESAQQTGNQGLAGIVLIGLTILMIGFFVVLTRAMFIAAIASVERGSPIDILKRSFVLSRGAAWRILGSALLFVVGGGIAIIAITFAVGSLVTLLLGPPEPWTVSALLIAIAGAAAQAVLATVFTVFFARLYAQRLVAPGVPTSGI